MNENRGITKKQLTLPFFEKFEKANATVDELRYGIFAPIGKVTENSLIYKEFIKNGRKLFIDIPGGKIVIKGNILTQIHRDILDVIFKYGTIEHLQNGQVGALFSGYETQKRLGRKSLSNNKWLKQKLDELNTTRIGFILEGEDEIDWPITDKSGYFSKLGSMGLRFTEDYMKFFGTSTTVDYKNETNHILEVTDPLIRAIIRFFFTHKSNTGRQLEEALKGINYQTSESNVKAAIRKLNEQKEKLLEFNIEWNAKKRTLYYSRKKGIYQYKPVEIGVI